MRRTLGLCADVPVAEVGSGEMNLNWLILLVGLAGGALPSWWVTSTYYQGVIAQEHEAAQKLVIEQQEQNQLALLAYAKRITDAGVQHDKDQATVNRLAADARRVRVVFPACPVPGTAEGGADSGGGTGTLSDKLDEYFGSLQKETGRLIERCDTLNIDAIRQNGLR